MVEVLWVLVAMPSSLLLLAMAWLLVEMALDRRAGRAEQSRLDEDQIAQRTLPPSGSPIRTPL